MSCAVELWPDGKVTSPAYYREDFMRSVLLWAIGIPLPIIIILWLVAGHA
jgi:hypothetical protein